MTTAKRRRPQDEEARKLAATVQRATGEWYCQSHHSYTRAAQTTWKGRAICVPCRERIAALADYLKGHR